MCNKCHSEDINTGLTQSSEERDIILKRLNSPFRQSLVFKTFLCNTTIKLVNKRLKNVIKFA